MIVCLIYSIACITISGLEKLRGQTDVSDYVNIINDLTQTFESLCEVNTILCFSYLSFLLLAHTVRPYLRRVRVVMPAPRNGSGSGLNGNLGISVRSCWFRPTTKRREWWYHILFGGLFGPTTMYCSWYEDVLGDLWIWVGYACVSGYNIIYVCVNINIKNFLAYGRPYGSLCAALISKFSA